MCPKINFAVVSLIAAWSSSLALGEVVAQTDKQSPRVAHSYVPKARADADMVWEVVIVNVVIDLRNFG